MSMTCALTPSQPASNGGNATCHAGSACKGVREMGYQKFTWYIQGNSQALFGRLRPARFKELSIQEISFRDCYLELSCLTAPLTKVRFEKLWSEIPSGVVEEMWYFDDSPYTRRRVWIDRQLVLSECQDVFDSTGWTRLEGTRPEHAHFFRSREGRE
jgi:hypothetical protein